MAKGRNANGMGSIRKVTKNGNIYWEGRYTDPAGKQRSVSAKTQAECAEKLKKKQAEITHGIYVTPTKQRLGDYMLLWLNQKQGTVSDGTLVDYNNSNRLYITPELGRVKLQDLRRSTCQGFVDHLKRRKLSAKYIRNIVGVLSTALHDAVRDELIVKNPAEDLRLPEVERKKPIAMDEEARTAFEQAIQDSPYRTIFTLMLEAGLRISEALGITWRNVDFQTGQIVIDGQLERRRGNAVKRARKDDTKSHRTRTTFVPQYMLDMLRQTKQQQNQERIRAGELWSNETGLVFTRGDGSPMPHTTVENAYRRIRNEIGHPEFVTHTLRKTHITNEMHAGTNTETIADSVGHTDTALTIGTYTDSHAFDEAKQTAAQRRQKEHEKRSKIG